MGDAWKCERKNVQRQRLRVGREVEFWLDSCLQYVCLWYNRACIDLNLTHAQKQALILLDGTQATEEACYHDDGADGDDHVGG